MYEINGSNSIRIEEITFSDCGIKESDIEELLRKNIDMICDDEESLLLVGQQTENEAHARSDLIAIDQDGNLVLIELKRDIKDIQARKEPLEFQAIRYAASCATIQSTDALIQNVFSRYVEKHRAEYGNDGLSSSEIAKRQLEDFLQTNRIATFNTHQRIILVASDFDEQTLSAVAWLNSNEVDIKEVSTSWVIRWKEAVCRQAAETYQVPSYCKDELSFLSGLVTALRCYDSLQGNTITVRAFSIQCFQNSKEFERTYQSEFLRLARKYEDGLSVTCEEQELSQRDQLAYLGIYARPELYELAGRCSIRMESGVIDLAPFYPLGIALPSTQVERLHAFQLDSICRIVFIENKTNYDEYIQSEITPDTLAIYQGGFLSPAKRRLFQILGRDLGGDVEAFFWGDIDLGGFQMFAQLQEIIPTLKPMRMSTDIVSRFQKQGLARHQTYLDRLQEALENDRYPLFSDVIQMILRMGITIEQEVFYTLKRESNGKSCFPS